MKRPAKPSTPPAPVKPLDKKDLERATGGASFIYAPAMKSKGGLDLSDSTDG